MRFPSPLPIDSFIPELLAATQKHQNLVITAAPGAGKTTRLPPALSDIAQGKVLVLEPRKMAAVAAATRISEEQNWQLGGEVGYQVRFANKTQKDTSLIFMTEALLAKKISEDPDLTGIEFIVLDEFHERSIHVDLAIGLIREMQELGHPIKLIVMSATLEAKKIAAFLGDAPCFDIPGKIFPLTIHHTKSAQLLQTNHHFYEKVYETTKEALQSHRQNILVFLPGVGEILRAFEKLKPLENSNTQLLILHGSLSLEEQKKVLRPSSGQKIILCTNIAESSVTIDGVDCVIDTGLAKVMRHDYKTGFSRLELSRISLGSATQRSGRAARQKEGVSYRLWSKMDENSMSPFEAPEVLRIDLADSLLFLAAQGISDFKSFTWFEMPPSLHLQRSIEFLFNIKALDSNHRITELGKNLLQWPLDTRLSRVMAEAVSRNKVHLGAMIASILQEKDFLLKDQHLDVGEDSESDLIYRLHLFEDHLHQNKIHGVSQQGLQLVKQSYEQLCNLANTKPTPHPWSLVDVHYLLLAAFPDRLCRRRGKGERALMSTGRGISLSPSSLNKSKEFFLALDGVESDQSADTLISFAHPIEKNWLFTEFQNDIVKKSEIHFDENKNQYFQKEQKTLWNLPIDDGVLKNLDATQAAALLPEVLMQKKDWFIEKNQSLQNLLSKLIFLKNNLPPSSLQKIKELTEVLDHSDTKITFKEVWLRSLFEQICLGVNQLNELIDRDLQWSYQSLLAPELNSILNDQIPSRIQVPSGSMITVIYPPDKAPYIEVRIQEIFGWTQVPQILGHIPLTIHLLGPNYRPVQVTSDLQSFWINGYPEVRKELRIKYPKHQWPEDPKLGIAEAKGRPRR